MTNKITHSKLNTPPYYRMVGVINSLAVARQVHARSATVRWCHCRCTQQSAAGIETVAVIAGLWAKPSQAALTCKLIGFARFFASSLAIEPTSPVGRLYEILQISLLEANAHCRFRADYACTRQALCGDAINSTKCSAE